MFFISQISFTHFKNYTFRKFDFDKKVVGIYGENGSGKTNLLDGIYYLCFTRSYFSRPEIKNVKQGYNGFRIEGILKNSSVITCVLRDTGKKEISFDNEPYKKFSEHLGKYPCVMIAPDDVQLINGGSEDRRKFMDTILAQTNNDYLQSLIKYNKLLQQRNSLLKSNRDRNVADEHLLDVFDEQLNLFGSRIYEWRKSFFEKIIPLITMHYNKIAGRNDHVIVEYQSQLKHHSLMELLRQNRAKDVLLQRTNAGTHKDDIIFTMDNENFRHIASQGQRKSLLFALRLAEYDYLKTSMKRNPLLLLDDVFEKLDDKRMHNLLSFLCTEPDTQVFITDTQKERLAIALQQINAEFQLIAL